MNAATRQDFFWRLAVGMMLMNLLNMALWAVGGYVPAALYAVLAVLALLFSRRPASNVVSVALLLAVFSSIVLSTPVTHWDARSIWFFHAKRIFLDGHLYAQLDNYAGWSHNDYPVLVPALAASLARGVGHWNEVFPKLSVVLVLMPALMALAWACADRVVFHLLAVAILLIGNEFLLNGYMDAVLAVYCAGACVLLSRLWTGRFGKEVLDTNPQDGILWGLMVSSLIFLKNEGLLAALLLWICTVPVWWGRWKWLAWSLTPFVLYAVLWRIPLSLHHIQGDLFGSGLVERTWTKVQDPASRQAIGGAVLEQSGLYGLALLTALAWAFKRARLPRLLPVAAFVGLYTLAVVAVYLVTPNDLTWHLATSVNRTLMTPNLCVVAGVVCLWGEQPQDPSKRRTMST